MREEVLDWLEEARADLEHAKLSFKSKSYNWACFAAHQAIEKAFKAFYLGILKKEFPRTHDLTVLRREIGRRLKLSEEEEEGIAFVSGYYFLARYPNTGIRRPSLSIGLSAAEKAIEIAECIVKRISDELKSSR